VVNSISVELYRKIKHDVTDYAFFWIFISFENVDNGNWGEYVRFAVKLL